MYAQKGNGMQNFNKSRGYSTEIIMEILKLSNPPIREIPCIQHDNKSEWIQTHHAIYNKMWTN